MQVSYSRMDMGPFHTKEPPRNDRPTHTHNYRSARMRNSYRVKSGSMVVKISICMAVLAAAILLEVFVLNNDEVVSTVSAEASGGEGEQDDVLGRLRFVAAGGVKSVFSVQQRWRLPVNAREFQLLEDETLLRIACKAGAAVSVPAEGEVRAIANDETYGINVRIHHGNDLESVYYHLADVKVEVGQPLLAGDTLGSVAEGGDVYVKVLQAGSPMDPSAFLDLEE